VGEIALADSLTKRSATLKALEATTWLVCLNTIRALARRYPDLGTRRS